MKKFYITLIFISPAFGASIGRAVLKNAPAALKESGKSLISNVGTKLSQGAESRFISLSKTAYDASKFKNKVPPSKAHIDIVNDRIRANLKDALTVHEVGSPRRFISPKPQAESIKISNSIFKTDYNKSYKSGITSILEPKEYTPVTRFYYEPVLRI